jgi:hypothetical protein
MPGARAWLNAIGIFAAASFVIFFFDLSPLWYSAALLAWIVRWRFAYRTGDIAKGPAPDEGAGLPLASSSAAARGAGAGGDADPR